MADPSRSEEQQKREDDDEEYEEEEAAYNPPAPSCEVDDTSTTVDPSYIISLIRKLLPPGAKPGNGSSEQGDDYDKIASEDISDGNLNNGMEQGVQSDNAYGAEISLQEGTWEENGCILWDLSVDKSHAEFMMENLILDVLLASLVVSNSMRIREICLGVIANLACHEVPMNVMNSRSGLIATIVDQLFLDDSPCLSETCRLLTLGVQGCGAVTWAEALKAEHVLSRILWIAGNTLNTQLLEKCLRLLLAILDNEKDVAHNLLPFLIDLGMPTLLESLLAGEMSNFNNERRSERYPILDSLLCVIETISVTDKYSQVISSNKELFTMVLGVVKFSDKAEVGCACVTAIVLLANILTDEPRLVHEISQDVAILEGLLDTLPLMSDDSQAWSAYWSIMARVLIQVEERIAKDPLPTLQLYCAVLLGKSDLIIEDVGTHHTDDCTEEGKISDSSGRKANAWTTSLAKMASILDRWIISRTHVSGDLLQRDDDDRADRLLRYCQENI